MTDEAIHSGGCGCGAVRYRAAGKPIWVAHCHCRDCRKQTGAALATWAGFAAASFAFTGAPLGYPSSPGTVRRFCGTCGTPLTFESTRFPGETDITICSLDDPEQMPPRDHTRAATKLSWVKLADGLPVYPDTRSAADG